MKKHLSTQSGEKPFPCTKSPKAFSERGHLYTIYKKVAYRENQFPCYQCPKTYSQGEVLKKCLRTHSEGADLKKQLRIYSSEKPFPFAQCSKAFSEGRDLKEQLRIHSGKNHFLGMSVLSHYQKRGT